MKNALKLASLLALSFVVPSVVQSQNLMDSLAGEFETAEDQQAAILKSLEESSPLETWPDRAVSLLRAWKARLDDDEHEAPQFLIEECFARGCVFHLRYSDPVTIQTSQSLLFNIVSTEAWDGPIAITGLQVTSSGEIENMVVLLNE